MGSVSTPSVFPQTTHMLKINRTLHRHTAAPPTAFGTIMIYVALRLLGMDKDEGEMPEIRALVHELGESLEHSVAIVRRGDRTMKADYLFLFC